MDRRRRRLLLLSGTATTPTIILRQSVFNRSTAVGMTTAGDATANTLGAVMRSLVSGYINGVWFFKTAADVSTSRTVGIYDQGSQVLLASGTSSGEAAGPVWTYVALSAPLRLDPMRRIVPAVLFPTGNYAAQALGFASAVTRGYIEALSDTDPDVGTGNGRFVSGASLAYPNGNFGSTNYWIDIDVSIPEWVDATTSGVAAGSILTPFAGTRTISTNGLTVENERITGDVVITADNVTLRNCEIISQTPFHAVNIGDTLLGVTVVNCTIKGLGTTGNGINGRGNMWRNDISGVENGVNLNGPSDVRDNYIHAFVKDGADPHYDGVECNGGSNHKVIHNTINLNQSQTTPVMFNNFFSGLSNIEVAYNYITGGGYTLYVDGNLSAVNEVLEATIDIHHNRMGIGAFGYFALNPGVWGSPTPHDNYDAITGLPV